MYRFFNHTVHTVCRRPKVTFPICVLIGQKLCIISGTRINLDQSNNDMESLRHYLFIQVNYCIQLKYPSYNFHSSLFTHTNYNR